SLSSVSRFTALRVIHSFPTRRSSDLGFTHYTLQILPNDISTKYTINTGITNPLLNGIPNIRIPGFTELGAFHNFPKIVKGSQFRSEEHTSELQSHLNLVCGLLLEKKNLAADGLLVFRHDANDALELPPLQRYDSRT